MNALGHHDVEIRHFHFFCGLGGGAKGFNRGKARVGSLRARLRCIGGIDVDPASIADFSAAAGVPGSVIDLFSEDQYRAFHGKAPPVGWREATVADIHRAAHGERPHIVFLSAPCKGFSGLLPESSSKTAKYQALNGLTLRGVWLMCEAWKNDPPELIVFENVPRIATRGRALLDQIVALLRAYGYAVAETTHDCGKLGGLGQSRKRFLLVARHEKKVPPFLYQPEHKRLRGVGEILERLPLPGDPAGGPMHRMPALQWKTWVRLAFVEAGSDWRSLNKLAIENGALRDFGIVPDASWQADVLGVRRWEEHTGVVAGRSSPTNGAYSVADPRAFDLNGGSYGVKEWNETGGVVTSARAPGQGAFSVADPRAPEASLTFKGMRVVDWDGQAGAITTQQSPGASAQSVADPRMTGVHHGSYGVTGWDDPSNVVTSNGRPASGVFTVADPRVDGHKDSSQMGVRPWTEPSGVVTGNMAAGAGRNSVADPRPAGAGPRFNNVFRIVDWRETAPAVTGGGGPSAGGLAVADPRPAPRDDYKQTKYRVTAMDEAAGTVIAASTTGNGAFAVADPRPTHGPNAHQNKMRVVEFGKPAGAVTGSDRVGSGAACVADPRPVGLNAKRDAYKTGGHYGVVPWEGSSYAVPGFAKYDRGNWSVADPREQPNQNSDLVCQLPNPEDRLVAVIRALDGTWHRPFTTLELAALQSLVDLDDFGATGPLVLHGKSDSAWRERIGNAVPPEAAEAIAGVMATTLLLAWSGETFVLSSTPIWVRPLAIGLSVDQRGNVPAEA